MGGYIYVHKGLLDLTATDAELQFVLAHEIAHVDLNHCTRQLTYEARIGELTEGIGSDLVQAGVLHRCPGIFSGVRV